MVSIDAFRKLALSFPDTEEHPHFHLQAFRYQKKIFATLWHKENKAILKLSLIDQSVFCSYSTAVYFPVPGAWDKQGATFVDLKKVRTDMLRDALGTAFNLIQVNKRLSLKTNNTGRIITH